MNTQNELVKATTLPEYDTIENLLERVSSEEITSEPVKKKYESFIDREILEQARKSNFLAERIVFRLKNDHQFSNQFADQFPEYQRIFFDTHFSLLKDFGIQFESPRSVVILEINRLPEKSIGIKHTQKLLLESWLAIKTTFGFVEYMAVEKKINSAHINSLYSLGTLFANHTIKLEEKHLFSLAYAALSETNKMQGVNEMPEIISKQELQIILFACPMFFSPKSDPNVNNSIPATINANEDLFMILSLFNDYIESAGSSYIRMRSANHFPSREPLPKDLLFKYQSLDEALSWDVNEAIFAPYHDIRLQEISDPDWQRIIPFDPYGIATFGSWGNSLKNVLMLKRWSGNGIMPSLPELVASTIQFLTLKKENLLKSICKESGWFNKKKKYLTYSNKYTQVTITIEEAEVVINKFIEGFHKGQLSSMLTKEY